MKRSILLLSIVLLAGLLTQAVSQDSNIRAGIDSVNTVLKANPYYDGFNEIAFNYTVSITNERELVVEMNFDGPFKWIYKAKIDDLELNLRNEPCRESPSSVCWVCKKNETGVPGNCIQAEMLMTDGGSQKENASNICISFSARAGICNNIYTSLNRLMTNVMNSNRQIQ